MKLLSPDNWTDYELIDCGNFEKLERIGNYTIIRPEPQALWNKKLTDSEWKKLANARFARDTQKKSYRFGGEENGGWTYFQKFPENSVVNYKYKDISINFKIALTSFGHIGLFPEQAENWKFIIDFYKNTNQNPGKVINLFAYTGGSSLAARASNAEVVHVDAVKQVISWANENMQLSKLDNIRWIVEDAIKYMRREVTRGNKYQGIILDPPAYGRGPAGEKWVLEEGLPELLELSNKISEEENSFLILNMYSLGYSSLVVDNLIDCHFIYKTKETGELFLQSKAGYKLPLGIFGRIIR